METRSKHILSDHPLRVYFHGKLSNRIIFDIFDSLETTVFKDTSIGVKRRILMSLIEILQNIKNYYDRKNIADRSSKFFVLEELSVIRIITENEILNEDVFELRQLLTELSGSTENEVKEKIKGKLYHSKIVNSSAGIGLLEIVRNSEGRFNYSFLETENKKAFFRLEVTLNTQ